MLDGPDTPSRTDYEVVVVGSGPAGSLAALQLARQGRRVLLLDRAKFPRPKVCGDCLNPRQVPLLQRLGLWNEFQSLPQHVVKGVQLEMEGHSVFRYGFRHDSFRSVARSTLDSWLASLAQAAGAEVQGETTVHQVDAERGLVTTNHGEFQAHLILAADGRNSRIARDAGLLASGPKCARVGWQTTLEGVAIDDDIHMNVFAGGYYGMVRIDEHQTNLCLVLDARSNRQPAELLAHFWPGRTADSWRSIHPIRRAPAWPVHRHVWLLGDAARVVEPFTGEGIFFAMASAVAAVESLAGVPDLQNFEALGRIYQKRHRALYQGELLVNRLTQWLLEKSSRGCQVLRLLKNQPSLLRYALERVVVPGSFP